MYIFDEEIQVEHGFREIIKKVLFLTKHNTDYTEVSILNTKGSNVTSRHNTLENVEFFNTSTLRITVFKNHRQGNIFSTDLSLVSIKLLVDKVIQLSQHTSFDKCVRLPNKNFLAFYPKLIDLHFFCALTIKDIIKVTSLVEATAYKFDKRIINTEGTSFCSQMNTIIIGNSLGLLQNYKTTLYSMLTNMIARDKNSMQSDFKSTLARHYNDLENSKTLGIKVAQNVISKLLPKKMSTITLPVIFISEISSSLFKNFSEAINGKNIYQKSSFLVNSLEKKIFPSWLSIIEEPHLDKGLGSKPFDNEGILTQSRIIVNKGILKNWQLDNYSACKLGLETTGNSGGIHNWLISYDEQCTFKKLLHYMYKGILITDLMGQGVNIVTGDYSRGISGFFIDKGIMQYPIDKMTVSGNLTQMFLNIVKLSNDINKNSLVQCGSVLISEMQFSGT